jgi:chemotaxis signal transduction protein
MKSGVENTPKSGRVRRAETVILFFVANQMFAIAANSVQEIRSTDSLAGSASELEQSVLPKVRHTVRRAHRTYFVVNGGSHFRLPATRPAFVLILRQLRVAVLVDRIERMADLSEVHPLPQAFEGEERRWYRGLAYVDDQVIPVVETTGFLTPEEFRVLDRSAKTAESLQELEGVVPI